MPERNYVFNELVLRGGGVVILQLLISRFASNLYLCREEQGSRCLDTFSAATTSQWFDFEFWLVHGLMVVAPVVVPMLVFHLHFASSPKPRHPPPTNAHATRCVEYYWLQCGLTLLGAYWCLEWHEGSGNTISLPNSTPRHLTRVHLAAIKFVVGVLMHAAVWIGGFWVLTRRFLFSTFRSFSSNSLKSSDANSSADSTYLLPWKFRYS